MSRAISSKATKRVTLEAEPLDVSSRAAEAQFSVPATSIHKVEAHDVRVFYRAAGDPAAPVILLLHGFPASSFMFRGLIPRLANRYRVIAPDLLALDLQEVPAERKYVYSFDGLATTIEAHGSTQVDRYALYVFDYGAPTGFRLAMAHPDRVTGRDSLRESPVQYSAAISGNHVLAGALHRARIRGIVVHVAVCAAAGRLGMLSAARYPIVLFGSLHLFPILPHSVMLYAALRRTHTFLAYLLFLAFVAHFGAILFHTLIVRDGMLSRMSPWRAARANLLETPFLLARHGKKGHLIALAARPNGSCSPGPGCWPTDNCRIVDNSSFTG